MSAGFGEILRERHSWALQHRMAGGAVMGCYSALVPEEILWACNVLPVQLWMSAGRYPRAQGYLPPYVCDCSKGILEQMLDETYAYLDGLLVAHVCETIRGLAGIWSLQRPGRFVHVFTPPAHNDEGARSYLRAELSNLAKRLAHMGGEPLREGNLAGAISAYNENRRLIKEMYELRGAHPGAVRPQEVVSAVLAATVLPKPLHNEMLSALLRTLEFGAVRDGTRVMLSGLTFENDLMGDNGLLRILEGSGGLVVWDDLASGMRYRLTEVQEDPKGSPLDMLVEGLLGPQPAPNRRPVGHKAHELLEMARKYAAQGIIFLVPKYCDPMLFEIPALTHTLLEKGFPSLVLETSGMLSEGQIRTRVEAFLEMISQ